MSINKTNWTRNSYLDFSKKKAITALSTSKMSAAMSFLKSIKGSHDKSYELYGSGNIVEMACLMTDLWNEKFINSFI